MVEVVVKAGPLLMKGLSGPLRVREQQVSGGGREGRMRTRQPGDSDWWSGGAQPTGKCSFAVGTLE